MTNISSWGYMKLMHPYMHVGPHGEPYLILRVENADYIKRDQKRIHELCMMMKRDPTMRVSYVIASWGYDEKLDNKLQVDEHYKLTSTGQIIFIPVLHKEPGNIGHLCGDHDKECYQLRAAGNENFRYVPDYGRKRA